ncbi:MAG: futalosine nucleosidase [Paenibacillus sp.]|jgi:futalosine hydrolase|uniref:futalosine hydrolase n=1 Tax=Paenibacillus sp. GCM10012303 TaxID=3317340 RepID=UPI0029EECC6B|nr:futalosine nucleosidase [Paenibacillus sp.]
MSQAPNLYFNSSTEKPYLIITAVEAEKEALQRGLGGDNRFVLAAAGVGTAAAAAGTAAALAAGDYRLVISAGIGGGFVGRAPVGSLVVADALIAADLGAETPDGFISVDELGFGSSRIAAEPELSTRLAEALHNAGHPVTTGAVLTVSTVTGTAETAERLVRRIPGAAAEAMEGYGVAVAAAGRGLPVLEIRAISNPVGPRDRSAWNIKDAMKTLESAGALLTEVLP